ncbi:MAG: ABC transporter permease [Geminicoccaceae bacterium]|nr:ABC transporter permease [Geminicoccaceae bacterium]
MASHAGTTIAEPGEIIPSGQPTLWGRISRSPVYAAWVGFAYGSTRRQFWLLAIPAIAWIAATHLGPILQMLHVSLLDSYPPAVGLEPGLTLANYQRFFSDSIFFMPFLRTLAFAMALTAATLIITFPVAYFLARHVRRDNQMALLLLLLIPFWVGEIVRTFAIMILLGNNGAINLLLRWLGLIERPIPFMYTGFSLSVGIIYLTSLYMLMPLYSALEKLPRSYSEAAADLGAGAWTRFRRITLPLTREGIASGCTLVFLISTGYYATPVLLGGPSTTVFAETIAGFFHVAGDQWPTGAAFACLMLLVSLAITGLFTRVVGRKRQGQTR